MGVNWRILLISEEKGYDLILNRLLKDYSSSEFEVDQVFSLEKAMRKVNIPDFDLVILDMSTGRDCLKAAETVCRASDQLPIIILSQSKDKYTARAFRRGVHQVIDKAHLDAFQLSQTVLAAIDRKKVENEIRMRDDILQAVNNAAEIFLTQSNWSAYLYEVLASLGKATKSDRVYVFRNSENGNGNAKAMLCTQWIAEGVHPVKTTSVEDGVIYKKEGYQRWLRLMERGESIHGDVESLPAEEQPLLMKLGVKSFVYVPVFIDHTWWGFIGFDQCNGHYKWSRVEVDALRTAANILGAAISRQATEEKLTYLASHDFLTDLPNRMLFEDRFNQAVARSERSHEKIGIISIDLDKFKLVNDTFGHPIGDEVLIEVARKLEEVIRGSDTCARIGGDEFAIIAEGIHNKGDVERVMQKVTMVMQENIIVDENIISISASMGASIYPNHGEQMEDLFRAADEALYQVKGTDSRYKVFSNNQISWLEE